MTATIPARAVSSAQDGRRRLTDDPGHGAEEAAKDTGQHLVDHVDIAREAVQNRAKRCGLEEEHRGAHDGVEHAVVHPLGRADHAVGVEDETVREEYEGGGDAERGVDT